MFHVCIIIQAFQPFLVLKRKLYYTKNLLITIHQKKKNGLIKKNSNIGWQVQIKYQNQGVNTDTHTERERERHTHTHTQRHTLKNNHGN